ncbi:hypothetical protein GCM10018980_25380 [Streptomyces capoamus]|uniref:Uncharacterized protein n=1 Tax=Streptomyces capoamus TaxID=68183 RepID=A0A919EWL1_9ACTN|nr:hypothetical protein [Streptomyces capoamus]GGW19859.1 hypothetical protein GCM10010501_60150 [Streptomyces libani subsp. rufus]GHG46410.1 hypothetical protein GCM10018980_25380 [Streptomyces capoamus]
MTVRAAWLLAGPPDGQTRTDTRLAPLGTFAPEGELTTRDGVIAGGAPLMATGAGAMQVQVGIGRALVQGTTAQGAYPVAVTVPETLTVGDGNAQYPRIDSIVLRVYDGLFDAQGKTAVALELVVGTAQPSPVEPNLPPSSLRLWSITVPAGASAGTGGINWASALADRRRFTASYGGIIPRGWGTSFTGAYDGQFRDVGGVLERWNATAGKWETYRPPRDVETISTGATAASGYSVTQYNARRVGGVCSFTVEVVRTGTAISVPAGGNISDQNVATLPAGWRPAYDVEGAASDGYGDGGARIATNGVVTLRTWVPGGSIQSGRNIRISAAYVL